MSVFVNNLPYELTEDEFKEAFSVFGPVASTNIVKMFKHGRQLSTGHGFVDFETEEAKERCLSSTETLTIKGREVSFREARPRPTCEDTVYIGNIGEGVTEDDLSELFDDFHQTELHIIKPYVEGGNGFGYAKFETKEKRDEAIAALNGKDCKGTQLLVRIANRPFSEEKPKRRYGRY